MYLGFAYSKPNVILKSIFSCLSTRTVYFQKTKNVNSKGKGNKNKHTIQLPVEDIHIETYTFHFLSFWSLLVVKNKRLKLAEGGHTLLSGYWVVDCWYIY